jgi:hypothetical protein
MKHELIKSIVNEAIKKGLYYAIDCGEGYSFTDDGFYQHPTQDIKLLCNQKKGDKYIGLDNLDDAWIFFFDKDNADLINNNINTDDIYPQFEGWIRWIHQGDTSQSEYISDYTTNLQDLIGIGTIIDKWDDNHSF